MTYANNLDPDEAPQNVGLHLRSKLFDIIYHIIYQQKYWVETMNFLKILKETTILKNYPACKELKSSADDLINERHMFCLCFQKSTPGSASFHVSMVKAAEDGSTSWENALFVGRT